MEELFVRVQLPNFDFFIPSTYVLSFDRFIKMKLKEMLKYKVVLLFVMVVLITSCNTTSKEADLESNFKNPPTQYQAKTWMHAVNGNMSKAGMTKDLEAIADVGLSGVLLFNVTQNIPSGDVSYNSPQHHAIIKHAAEECKRLGLTFGFHNCDGWSSSGGPWITPENSMKELVWNSTIVEGGKSQRLQLDQPFTREGYYKDVAVLAYPTLAAELADESADPLITSSDKTFDVSIINDGNPDNKAKIQGKTPWVQFDYGKAHTLRSISVVTSQKSAIQVHLLSSNDGEHFTLVKNAFAHKTGGGRRDFFDNFEPVSARYFRVQFFNVKAIGEIDLKTIQTLGCSKARVGLTRVDDDKLLPIGTPEKGMLIDPKTIIDLSGRMDENGNLEFDLPSGQYTILRFGYTSNGLKNEPASAEGQGLECDKFSKKAVKSHYDAFITTAIQNMKGNDAFQYIEIDSYELGLQNWTHSLDSIFKATKGYDIRPFLPLFAGRFVQSAKASENVLDDFRQVACDLLTNNYYAYFSELCHNDGLETFFEPYGDGLINELDVAKTADMNMGEFWPKRDVRMMKAAVSGSRIYGKNVVWAESFTSVPTLNWKAHPLLLKQHGDSAWIDGVNQFMLHRFAHQSNTHVKPGITLGFWGTHFDRTQTWWYNAGKAWFKYMARGSYMLQQGIPVSDLLVFIGEGAPNSHFYRDDFTPRMPRDVNFDCINADAFINRISIVDGHLQLPDGLRYEALVLKNCDKLSLPALRKIHQIAEAGIPIVGMTSIVPFGHQVNDELKQTFEELVTDIKTKQSTYSHTNWEEIFSVMDLERDFKVNNIKNVGFTHRSDAEKDIYFFYNSSDSAKRYECDFRVAGKIPELWNPVTGEIKKMGQFSQHNGRTQLPITLEGKASVFVVFRQPSAGVKHLPALSADERIEYHLDQDDALHCLVKENGHYQLAFGDTKKEIVVNDIPAPMNIQGQWELEFLKEHHYKAVHTFDQLSDWKDHPNKNINYYSGTAIYRKDIQLEEKQSDCNYQLNLGQVSVVAEVFLNGKDLGVLWLSPYTVDITDVLVEGNNKLEVRITNQWTNRLIGDERFLPVIEGDTMPQWFVENQPMPASKRNTYCTHSFYNKNSKLISAGLLGPVSITSNKNIKVVE